MDAKEDGAFRPGPGDISMVATGDSLLTQRLRPYVEPEYLGLLELIRSADVRLTNLETLFNGCSGYPAAESGGTWVSAEPSLSEELKWLGFNLFACANNHSMDWSSGGLLAHLRTLDRAGLVWAGIGKDAGRAREPAYLELGAGRIGLVSLTTTIANAGRAGEPRPDCQGRPGANTLRNAATYRPAADADGGVGRRVVVSQYHQPDADRILAAIRDARRQAGWVLCSMHTHEGLPGEPEKPLPFQRHFAHAAVDAGADAVVCHGPHVVRGVELYGGKPIFHGLGNFIFQNETVKRQPADFYEQFGLGPEATPADAFDARDADPRRSFTGNPAYWESVVAWWRYAGSRLAEVKLYPITLGFGLPRAVRGRPLLASGEQAQRIIARVAELSQAFDVQIRAEDGVGVVQV
ncbi:MAG: CapA family protein [Chitinophagales bacterium]